MRTQNRTCNFSNHPPIFYEVKDKKEGTPQFFNSDYYSYGFNGHERLDEISGSGNAYDFGARILDPRLGKFLSTDPLEKKYPHLTPYHFSANSPILFYDTDGKDFFAYGKKNQRQTIRIMRKTFGRKHGFGFDDSGQLHHNGKGNPNGFEKAIVFNHFKNKIVDNKDVNVTFKGFNKISMTHNGNKYSVGEGNAFTAQTLDSDGNLSASIGIGWNMKSSLLKEEGVKSNKASSFWHEVAHPIATLETGKSASDPARSQASKFTVGFENVVRSILGLDSRSGDGHGVQKGAKVLPGSQGSDSKPFNNFDSSPKGKKSFSIPNDVG